MTVLIVSWVEMHKKMSLDVDNTVIVQAVHTAVITAVEEY